MAGSKASGNRSRRTHVLGACKTCRRRHAKCDQRRPSCQMCRASGVLCEGFADDIRWVSARPPRGREKKHRDAAKHGPRRLLYTEKSRLSMSDALSADLLAGSIDASLAEIDLRTRDSERGAERSLVVRPFSVLDLSDKMHQDIAAQPAVSPDKAIVSSPRGAAPPVETSLVVSPSLAQESIASMNDLLQWSDLFSMDLQMPDSMMSTAFDTGDALFLEPDAQAAVNGGAIGMTDSTLDANTAQEIHSTVMPQISADLGSEPADVLVHAHFLLRHFQDHVISRMSAIPLQQKSPWKILNVPSAVVTYSDLTFLSAQNISHARLANLYCLLACAAHHLSVDPSTTTSDDSRATWHPIAEHAYRLAREHMQTSLRNEIQPKVAKYKDQLMAICALTEYAIISGQPQDARCYMVDAERLLRLRGLSKRRISQKARLLHHVYTWLRIISESTYTLHDYTPSEHFLDALRCSFRCPKSDTIAKPTTTTTTTTPNEHPPRLDDFLRLARCPSDSDLNIHEPKSQEVGLHEIHLQDSRSYPDTLYHQIYGIPETWLSLVSQTTRLANVMETFRLARRTRSVKQASSEAWDALHRRSARLENMVCALASRKGEREGGTGTGTERANNRSEPGVQAHACLLDALNAALVIFFYRRIREVHPLVLEGFVDQVVSSLGRFDAALTEAGWTGPGTAWPLFIAGCEAMTAERRGEVLRLLEKGEARCGFAGFRVAREVLKEVWVQQDEHLTSSRGESVPTWLDVTKRGQIWPILA
ncbi:Zn(II)2Cys6 transcription factor [Aspergillus saccharolyticus JOP 1030-1]|uniref:Zn(2)-C6 fungal-type domain-containing protein n=1 Tax=Aspergillus saccharolyticus JOP 1030-1 TaxID=1450539 RepID=A0A318ZC24_9EURO|nr:hypothetical protein BP01DRAFT_374938 [Aspergillus saccharolyticus JOP 1030-1]PYH44077.1 hypothetical protein BP01DRAFT_374938 [Aspergillus saccharolyticus JOP 1030-1]